MPRMCRRANRFNSRYTWGDQMVEGGGLGMNGAGRNRLGFRGPVQGGRYRDRTRRHLLVRAYAQATGRIILASGRGGALVICPPGTPRGMTDIRPSGSEPPERRLAFLQCECPQMCSLRKIMPPPLRTCGETFPRPSHAGLMRAAFAASPLWSEVL